MILMNDFKKEYTFFKSDVDSAIKRTLDSGWYILGKEVEKFETSFAAYTGAKYCIGVANGMQAIQISLMAAGVGTGDEVITTPLSAIETTFAITAIGAIPVFADIDEYYHLDPNKVKEKITKKTKAILPVHLYGQAIDLTNFTYISNKYGIPLIEDACQAHGTYYEGKHVGTFGAAGAFSFYPTKNLGAYGDGGAIITNDKAIYEQCVLLRNAGRVERYKHISFGLNSRLDEIQAAILSAKLPKLNEQITKRQHVASLYRKHLAGIKQIRLPKIRKGTDHSFHLFVISTDYRNSLQAYLRDQGVETHIHFPTPIPQQPCLRQYSNISVPKATSATEQILSLVIHPYLSDREVDKIIRSIKQFYISL